ESNLDILAVVAMPIDMHGGRIPDVVQIHFKALAAHDRMAAAANNEVDLGRVLPVGHGPLARQQDIERDLDAGCEAVSALCAMIERRRPLAGRGRLARRSTSASIVSFGMTIAGQRSIVPGRAPV